jgi:hypothetical protein
MKILKCPQIRELSTAVENTEQEISGYLRKLEF